MANFYKRHIKDLQLELSSKAGRTRQEMKEALGIDKLHKLSSNENALGPSPLAQEAIRKCVHRIHEYDHRTDDQFRMALQSHFSNRIHESQFISTNSGLEIIELVMQGFLEPGDEIIISNPTFHVYEIFGKVQGAKIIDVPLRADDFLPDVERIHDAITNKTKLLIIANPNNPTGVAIERGILTRLIEGVPDNVVVLIDEVYHHFSQLDDFPYAIDYIEKGHPVVGMHSFSKAYGLAGIRLAYGFASREMAEYLQKLRRPFFINTMSMEAGLAALQDKDHFSRTQALIKEEKSKLYSAFDRLGLKYWESHTNFILVRPEVDHYDLIDRMLQYGIMLRSGDNNGAAGCIRITIGLPESNKLLIKALESEL